MALTNKLTAIAEGFRESRGTTDKLSLEQMAILAAEPIGTGGGELPEEAFNITGVCSYRFAYGSWDWFIREYGNKISTKDIGDMEYMFYINTGLESIPFDLNCEANTYHQMKFLFSSCLQLMNIGKIINAYPSETQNMFNGCQKLRYIPEFINFNTNRINTYKSANISNMFNSCYSLRSIPEGLLKQLYNGAATAASYAIFYNGFEKCYALDEIRGLNPQTSTVTSSMFKSTFDNCHRLKDVIFAVQEDGTPYNVNWKSQSIDLSIVGFAGTLSRVTDYNSGITADKQVTDDASYAALKDDPDWFTGNVAYSRYNKTSAINTINSLPDTSAYLATAGGTNTIKFNGENGSKTDGGAINTMTEEEIAVATAKGWTVTFA